MDKPMIEPHREPGSFIVEGPGEMRRRLRCLYLYDKPLIFTLPHEGRERLFICFDETDDASIFLGATPAAGLVDRICSNAEPLVRGFEQGPFYRMIWPHASPWPAEIIRMIFFPEEMLPDPDLFLGFDRGYQMCRMEARTR